jgi:hypothetical protein
MAVEERAPCGDCNNTNNVARMRGDYYKTGIGLTTGFIGSHTVTHNYSVYTSQLTTTELLLLL